MKPLALLLVLLFCLMVGPLLAEEITLYSHRHYAADEELFARFTDETGIKVNVVRAGADELMERLKSEGPNTPADVFLTADAARLHLAKSAGLLAPVSSSVLTDRIPAYLRDPQDHWFGFTTRARVLVYAPDRVSARELSTYEALADPMWRGRLVSRSSSNIYSQSILASMIAAHGEAAAEAWARAFRANMARPPQGNDRDQIRAVAAGLADVALVNTYYLGLLNDSDAAADREAAAAVRIFFPNQDDRGTHVNISGGGMVEHADNPEGARRFLEFMVSDTAQRIFPLATSEYPVASEVEVTPLMQTWGDFVRDSLHLEELGKHHAKAVRAFNRAGWE